MSQSWPGWRRCGSSGDGRRREVRCATSPGPGLVEQLVLLLDAAGHDLRMVRPGQIFPPAGKFKSISYINRIAQHLVAVIHRVERLRVHLAIASLAVA